MNTKEQFNIFMSQLQETNRTLDFYCDFEKIANNIRDIKINLNTLNYLLTVPELKQGVDDLWESNPAVFNVLGILIAIRDDKKERVLDYLGRTVCMNSFYSSSSSVYEFLEKTGLAQIFRNHQLTNLVDYVFGIETGLDTNARKNRGGHVMEGTIHKILQDKDIYHKSEIYSTDFEDLLGLGTDKKRFDFAVKTKVKTYLIEVNFYNDGGSKLNEVARSYSELAPLINHNAGYEFVWITDGGGWKKASNKLEQAFYSIPSIYNLTSMDELLSKLKSEIVIEF